MKHLIYISAIIIALFTGYWIGSQTWIFDINKIPHHFNTEEARLQEVKYCNATLEALHYFYQKDTIYWNGTFKNTAEYHKIDSINKGDWEDFYVEW